MSVKSDIVAVNGNASSFITILLSVRFHVGIFSDLKSTSHVLLSVFVRLVNGAFTFPSGSA